MRRFAKLIFSVLALSCCLALSARDFIVYIDAGHGGSDPGAKSLYPDSAGSYSLEKDINLAVAKKLGRLMARTDGVDIRYTRKNDYRLSLQDRARLANEAKADLFISIHTNSAINNPETCFGAETYVLGDEKSDKNLEVVARENSAAFYDSSDRRALREFQRQGSAEDMLISELIQDTRFTQSVELAEQIQKKMVSIAHRYDRGVKQSNRIYLLWATNMPSVLVELDFICNPEQEAFLTSDEGQDKCAQAIYEAFLAYRQKYAER